MSMLILIILRKWYWKVVEECSEEELPSLTIKEVRGDYHVI